MEVILVLCREGALLQNVVGDESLLHKHIFGEHRQAHIQNDHAKIIRREIQFWSRPLQDFLAQCGEPD